MPTPPFSAKLRKAGLYRGLSSSHIQIMEMIEKEPLPVPDKTKKKGLNIPSPTPIPGSSLGPVINQKCAAMRDGFYTLTQSGADYLAKLRQEGLI